MKKNKRYLVSILYIIIGILLIGCGFTGAVDEFWNGCGCGLFVVGIIQLIRFYRLNKNEAYREMVEIELSDERNHFLRNKAWAWAGYLFVIISGIGTIVFKVIGQDLLSLAASWAVCLVLILFWGSYHILKRKY